MVESKRGIKYFIEKRKEIVVNYYNLWEENCLKVFESK